MREMYHLTSYDQQPVQRPVKTSVSQARKCRSIVFLRFFSSIVGGAYIYHLFCDPETGWVIDMLGRWAPLACMGFCI